MDSLFSLQEQEIGEMSSIYRVLTKGTQPRSKRNTHSLPKLVTFLVLWF